MKPVSDRDIPHIPLEPLTERDVLAWRQRLAARGENMALVDRLHGRLDERDRRAAIRRSREAIEARRRQHVEPDETQSECGSSLDQAAFAGWIAL
jgi:hypothetical protein